MFPHFILRSLIPGAPCWMVYVYHPAGSSRKGLSEILAPFRRRALPALFSKRAGRALLELPAEPGRGEPWRGRRRRRRRGGMRMCMSMSARLSIQLWLRNSPAPAIAAVAWPTSVNDTHKLARHKRILLLYLSIGFGIGIGPSPNK